MKGWVDLVGWLVADGLPTLVVTHQLQVKRRTGKVRRLRIMGAIIWPNTDRLHLIAVMWGGVVIIVVDIYMFVKIYRHCYHRHHLGPRCIIWRSSLTDGLTVDHYSSLVSLQFVFRFFFRTTMYMFWVFSEILNEQIQFDLCLLPSVLWCCWLGGRKGIQPVKNRVVGYWRGYLPGARCRLAYGPADATATYCFLLQ